MTLSLTVELENVALSLMRKLSKSMVLASVGKAYLVVPVVKVS
jgi:hypothetical protein